MILDWDKIEIVEEKSTAVNLTAEDRMIVFSGEKGSDGTKGERGKDGIAATVAVGTVTTLPSNAGATVVNRGTPTAAVFDFGIPRGASGSGGASMWGEITGTLSDQTDLQTALNAKANTADLGTLATQDEVDYETDVTNKPTLGTMSAVDDAPSNGSEYVRKNGQWAVASGGGSTSASWGAITGNLSNQTDLQNALDDKADGSDIAEEWVSGNAYLEGTLMTHDGKLYKAIRSFQSSTWDASNVQETTVSELIAGKADSASLGTMATVNDAPSNGNEYIRKNGAWAVSSGGGGTVVSAAWGDITGTLSDQTDLKNALDAKANESSLGDLATMDALDYTSNKLTNKPTLGTLAGKNAVDYSSSEVTNKPILGALASKDNVDYSTEVTNKPTLGGMASVDDAPSNGSEYVRKNGAWAVASTPAPAWGGITGTLANQTDLQTALDGKEDTLTFDTTPTSGSTNPVTSGGVSTALSAKANSADLGSLATKNAVDYSTEVTNKPTLGDLADHNTVDYATEVTNKPTLGGIQVRPNYLVEQDGVSTLDVGSTLASGTIAFIYEAS